MQIQPGSRKSPQLLALARLILLIAVVASLGALLPDAAPGASANLGDASRAPDSRGDSREEPQSSAQLLGWSALPNGGLNNFVGALTVSGSDLYVGGGFTATADGAVTNLSAIAKLSGGVWSALPHGGLNGAVAAMAVSGSDLYVGGDFTATADGAVTNLNNIAKLSGGVWSALPNGGLDKMVLAFAIKGDDLYVGGYFNGTFDGSMTHLIHIARLRGGQWSALPHGGLHYFAVGDPGNVRAFTVVGDDLYVGGNFKETADADPDSRVKDLNSIARFDGFDWHPLPNKGLNYIVEAFALSGSDLYVGGGNGATFDGAVTNLWGISRLSGGAWSALPNGGLAGSASTLAIFGGDLFAGGNFPMSGDGTVTDLLRIARLSGGAWSRLPNLGFNNNVAALAVIGNELYVGGYFSETADGAVPLRYITKVSALKTFLPILYKSSSST